MSNTMPAHAANPEPELPTTAMRLLDRGAVRRSGENSPTQRVLPGAEVRVRGAQPTAVRTTASTRGVSRSKEPEEAPERAERAASVESERVAWDPGRTRQFIIRPDFPG